MSSLLANRAGDISAHRGFFPAAILIGGIAVPLWVVLLPSRPDLVLWHGHELLFGFGLAVVAGFLLARIRRHMLIVLLATWSLARIAMPLGSPILGGVAAFAFVTLLAVIGGSGFLRSAKQMRNAVFGVVLIGFAAAEATYQAGVLGLLEHGEARGLRLALDLLTLLMLQMGGRVIPAATAGALLRRGQHLPDRVQPRLEAAIGGLMAIVIVAGQIEGWETLAGAARLMAAALALVRLGRWQSWKIAAIPDLAALHLGYAWLGIGLALTGAGPFIESGWSMAGIHALGIGALGTLTLTMMARTAATRRRLGDGLPKSILLVAVLLAVAALLRIAAALDGPSAFLYASAASWTFAFGAFAVLYRRVAGSREKTGSRVGVRKP